MTSDELLRRASGVVRRMARDLEEIAKGIDAQSSGRFNADTSAMERACLSKRAYATPEGAGQAAKNANEQRGVENLRVYACDHCKQFHLTSMTLAEFHGLDLG